MPAGAFGYALQTLLAVMILHETVSPRRWIGVALICVGVVLVGQTKPRTTTARAGQEATKKTVEEQAEQKVAASC
jgi:drug/metabolite transporter (DMT)-like permease